MTTVNDFTQLSTAIDSFNSSATSDTIIDMAPATYQFSGQLTITRSDVTLTIRKTPNAIGDVILTAAASNRHFTFNASTQVTLENITLNNGDTTGFGGSIYAVTDSNVTLNNILFENNASNNGSAIFSSGLNLTINYCTFSANNIKANADGGGAINWEGSGEISINHSNFNNNDAKSSVASGGGAILSNGNLTVTNSTFSSNEANNGGAIDSNGNLTVTNSTFTQNSSTTTGLGGAILCNSGTIIVTNSTFNLNIARFGQAIYNNSNCSINFSTFYNSTLMSNNGNINISNSIFVEPDNSDFALNINNGTYDLLGGNIIYAANIDDIFGGFITLHATDIYYNTLTINLPIQISNIITLPLADNGGPTETIAIPSDSPAIGQALINNGIIADQRGEIPDIPGNRKDSGAYEFVTPIPPVIEFTQGTSPPIENILIDTEIILEVTPPQTVTNNLQIALGLIVSGVIPLNYDLTLITYSWINLNSQQTNKIVNNTTPGTVYTINGRTNNRNPNVDITIEYTMGSLSGNIIVSGVPVNPVSNVAELEIAMAAFDTSTTDTVIDINVGDYQFTKELFVTKVAKKITLRKVIGASGTVKLLAAANNRHFTFNDLTDVTIDGLTLSDGNSIEDGGSILAKGKLMITNSIFSDNNGYTGGAIYQSASDSIYKTNLSITNSTFTQNSAQLGGAIYKRAGEISIFDSIFLENTSNYIGGAIDLFNATSTFKNLTFDRNSCNLGSGGAIELTLSNASITNSTFSQNTADYGGAVHCVGSNGIPYSTTITNSTFFQNSDLNVADYGSIYSRGNNILNLNFVTIYANDILSKNGFKSSGTQSNITISNSIIIKANNQDSLFNIRNGGKYTSGGGNLIYASDISNFALLSSDLRVLYGTPTVDIVTVPLSNNGGPTQTLALPTDSPAIGKALTSNNILTDQRNYMLSSGSNRKDSGALEYNAVFIAIYTVKDIITLEEAIKDFNNNAESDTIININSGNYQLSDQLIVQNSTYKLILQKTAGSSGVVTLVAAFNKRHFEVNSNTNVTMDGLSLFGNADKFTVNMNGGSIKTNGQLIVKNSTFSNNLLYGGSSGGCIYSTNILTVTNSTFSDNYGYVGACIFNNNSSVTVTNSKFTNNSGDSSNGSAVIYASNLNHIKLGVTATTLKVINSTFSKNKSTGGGSLSGTIYVNGRLLITGSTFSENETPNNRGTDIFILGYMQLTNSTFFNIAGNTNSISSIASTNIINFVTFYNSNIDILGERSESTISNSILINSNAQFSGQGKYISGGGNIIYTQNSSNFEKLNSDKLIELSTPVTNIIKMPLSDNGGPTQTFALADNSPAIGNVLTYEAILKDQRGYNSRGGGSRKDSGSFENNNTITATSDDLPIINITATTQIVLDIPPPTSSSVTDNFSYDLGQLISGDIPQNYDLKQITFPWINIRKCDPDSSIVTDPSPDKVYKVCGTTKYLNPNRDVTITYTTGSLFGILIYNGTFIPCFHPASRINALPLEELTTLTDVDGRALQVVKLHPSYSGLGKAVYRVGSALVTGDHWVLPVNAEMHRMRPASRVASLELVDSHYVGPLCHIETSGPDAFYFIEVGDGLSVEVWGQSHPLVKCPLVK